MPMTMATVGDPQVERWLRLSCASVIGRWWRAGQASVSRPEVPGWHFGGFEIE